jgi:hypothetical protein
MTEMLPAWMIDKIKKDDELRRRNGERHIDQPARDERGNLQNGDVAKA